MGLRLLSYRYGWAVIYAVAICIFLPAVARASCHPIKYCCDGTTVDDGQGSCNAVYCSCYPCACWPWLCDPCYNNPDPSCANADDPLNLPYDSCADNIFCDDPFPDSENTCQAQNDQYPAQPVPQDGKPVNLFSGAETFERTDLVLGTIYPISIQRRFNSGSTYQSRLGYGWGLNYDKRLYTYPDGSVVLRMESGWKRRFKVSGSEYESPVGESGILVKNADGSFTLTKKNGSRENYDIYGRLATLVDTRGNSLLITYESSSKLPLWGLLRDNVGTSPLIVSYDYRISRIEEKDATGNLTGVWMDFQYDPITGMLIGITDSTGRIMTYDHDGYGNLTSVSGPNGASAYTYGDSSSVHHLVDIDEGRGIFTNVYDSRGRVSQQLHAGGDIVFEYLVPKKKTRVTTTITDESGWVLDTRVRTVEFDVNGQIVKDTDTLGNVNNYTRDSQGRITYQDYWENTGTAASPNLVLRNAVSYTYDGRGNVLTRTDAVGDPLEKTATYTYHPVFNKVATETVKSVVGPAENRVTTYTYTSGGNLQTVNVTGLLNPTATFNYTTTYGYDTMGRLISIDGPRTDVQDITSFTYDPTTGFLTSMTRPLIGTTTFADHDPLGNPRTIIDPNNQTYLYTYDSAGRVLTVKEPWVTNPTQYVYITDGCTTCGSTSSKLDYIILPKGNKIDFDYDSNGNLIKISDNAGNSINYTYDSDGNRLWEEIKNSSGALQTALTYVYDALDRLKLIANLDSSFTEFDYDFNGNLTSLTDPKNNFTTYQYDTLGRLDSVTQPGSITTTFGYTANNNLASLRDGNNNMTTFQVDDMGRVYQTISPDTGTTSYAYDPSGNLISKTDAKGVTTTYTYDAANRLTQITFPADPAISFTYDSCTNGKGRLCAMTDQAGTTSFEYYARGLVEKEIRVIDGISYVTQYTYDANDHTATITYPSGMVITYVYSNDRISRVDSTVSGVVATLANGIDYKPFGGMTGITYGNALNGTLTYDNQYRLTGITTGSVQSLTYGQDANTNITSITDALDGTKNKSYGYDALDRLTSGTGPWGSLSWTYDKVGNRLTEGASSYDYIAGTNRLSSVGSKSYFYDDNGNTTAEGTRQYVYNQNQRLIEVHDGATSAAYTYNGSGQRVKKVVGSTTTIFHYDLGGRLIAESDGAGTFPAEYVYLNGNPLAMIRGGSTYYYHNDHLGTPQKMTDSTGAVVWSAEFKPFGEAVSVTGSVTNNLRFPGQYFDAETGLHYNYFRDYNPLVGRYVEADPIGLAGGLNLFAYVQNNPVFWIDPFGLDTEERGVTVGLSLFGLGGDLTITVVEDDKGEYGFVVTPAGGGSAEIVSAAAQVVGGTTSANSINDLVGASVKVSGGGGVVIGGNYSRVLAEKYTGDYVSAGLDLGVIPINFSGMVGKSYVINIPDLLEYTFFSLLGREVPDDNLYRNQCK